MVSRALVVLPMAETITILFSGNWFRIEHTLRTASAFRTEAPPNLCTVICAMMPLLFVQ